MTVQDLIHEATLRLQELADKESDAKQNLKSIQREIRTLERATEAVERLQCLLENHSV